MFKVPKFKYNVKTFADMALESMEGQPVAGCAQCFHRLVVGGVSLAQVWAVKRAIDVASHAVEVTSIGLWA